MSFQQTYQANKQQHQQKKIAQQQPTFNQNEFKKRSEDDEDTLSLDSEKSVGFINEPVNNWPAWSMGQPQTSNNTPPELFMRYPVNYPPPQVQQSFNPPTNYGTQPQPTYNFTYSNSQIPNNPQYDNRGPVFAKQNNTAPTYFSRSPVYYPPPQINNNLNVVQPRNPISLNGKAPTKKKM